MMNNFTQLLNMAKSGGDPRQMLSRMAASDPRFAMANQMLQGKNSAQLQQMAQNIARERGIDLNSVINSLGIR